MPQTDPLAFLEDLFARAKAAGADAADGHYVQSMSLSTSQRMGAREDLERSESLDMSLRVFIGQRQACVASSDLSPAAVDELVERAVAMAKVVPEDPWCGLADPKRLARTFPDLDLFDDYEPDAEELYGLAAEAEDAALAVPGVTNSEGGGAGWSQSSVMVATSHGFSGGYSGSSMSVSASVIAGEGTEMERDYDYSSVRHRSDLRDAGEIGREAGMRAVKRLNPKQAETTSVPVVYDPRVSGGIVGHLSGAISGTSVARGTSFLKDRLGEQVFADGINIVDDPHRIRGLSSRPFDGEGVANDALKLCDNGVLTTWVMDTASANQLGLETSGRAARGGASPPHPATTNLYMEAGTMSPEELMADIKSGFYVTELIGFGINGLTGDYSRGAAGYWIEDGEIAWPVSEMTVAGNLKDMFMNLTPADNLVFRFGTNAPTIRIEGMTVAGA
jgi:PmbA protein